MCLQPVLTQRDTVNQVFTYWSSEAQLPTQWSHCDIWPNNTIATRWQRWQIYQPSHLNPPRNGKYWPGRLISLSLFCPSRPATKPTWRTGWQPSILPVPRCWPSAKGRRIQCACYGARSAACCRRLTWMGRWRRWPSCRWQWSATPKTARLSRTR